MKVTVGVAVNDEVRILTGPNAEQRGLVRAILKMIPDPSVEVWLYSQNRSVFVPPHHLALWDYRT